MKRSALYIGLGRGTAQNVSRCMNWFILVLSTTTSEGEERRGEEGSELKKRPVEAEDANPPQPSLIWCELD